METLIALVVGVVLLVAWAFLRLRIDESVTSIEDQIRELPDFDAADIYISKFSLTGIAIDRGRRELLLVDDGSLRRSPLSSIVGCEILEDGIQVAYADTGSQFAWMAAGGIAAGALGALVGGLFAPTPSANNVKKVVLRIVTDHFDKPNHDIVLLDRSWGKKGVKRDDVIYKEALEAAELWHHRVVTMMLAAD